MKRTLLALAVPALLAANAANADIEFWNQNGNIVSMYGRVIGENIISKQGNGNGDDSNGRIGFTGLTQISNYLAGYGRAEFQTNAGSNDHELRYAFAGLDFGTYGTFDYGRNDGVSKMVTSFTDVLPEFGGDAGDMVLLGDRENAVATYRNQGFYGLVDGLNFALQYADRASYDYDDEDEITSNDTGAHKQNRGARSAFGISADYAILNSGFTVGGSYALTSKASDEKILNGLDKDSDESRRGQSWVAGGKYEYQNLYVAAIYNYSKNVIATPEIGVGADDSTNGTNIANYLGGSVAKNVKGYEMVVAYGLDLDVGRVTPSVAYIQDKAKYYNDKDDKSINLSKYVNLGLQYDFNKNFSAFVDYKINLLKSDDVGDVYSKDSVALALIYQF